MDAMLLSCTQAIAAEMRSARQINVTQRLCTWPFYAHELIGAILAFLMHVVCHCLRHNLQGLRKAEHFVHTNAVEPVDKTGCMIM